MTEPLSKEEPIEEVMAIFPHESPESILEQDAQEFIEEEDDSGETLELPKEKPPPRVPIELKPLPPGLRYASLNVIQNLLLS